ncbi:MAG TPA: hypothetical protein VHT92_09410 [Candidatus Cybelea sp.]|nr:hypothetical protein [Candidatus Cybelea sp.]
MSKWTASLAAVALAALTACASGKSSGGGSPQPSAAASAAATGAPAIDCGSEAPVWTLESAKVYLVEGDRLYGKTKHGRYLCRSEAHAEGFRPARRPFRHRP